MSNHALTPPPDDAWIERRTEIVTETEQTHSGGVPGKTTHRIIGNLRGRWPEHGTVRNLPTTSGDMVITEVILILFPDGTVRNDNP